MFFSQQQPGGIKGFSSDILYWLLVIGQQMQSRQRNELRSGSDSV
jgi:hypothetical protein